MNNASVLLATRIAEEAPFALNAAKLAGGVLTWAFKFFAFKRWVYPVDDATVPEGSASDA
jgi:hypothetical protein